MLIVFILNDQASPIRMLEVGALFRSIAWRLGVAVAGLAPLVGIGVGVSGNLIAARTAEDLTYARLDGLAVDRSDSVEQLSVVAQPLSDERRTVRNGPERPARTPLRLDETGGRSGPADIRRYVADNTNADRSLHLRFTSGNELRQRARAGAAGHAGAGAKRAGFEDTTAA